MHRFSSTTEVLKWDRGCTRNWRNLHANTLGIPIEYIRIGGNNTNAIANCPPTAASTGFDLCGGAVEKACRILRNRLEELCRNLEQFTPHSCIEDWRTKWAGKVEGNCLPGMVSTY